VEKVIAIELLAACQAIEFLRPLKTTQPLEEASYFTEILLIQVHCNPFRMS
jgi:histidine ammonia-lyase